MTGWRIADQRGNRVPATGRGLLPRPTTVHVHACPGED